MPDKWSGLKALLALSVLLPASAPFVCAQGAEVTFDLEIENGKVVQNERLIGITQGDAVKLRWTTDRPIILHLHGYDIEQEVKPGAVAEMAFEARAAGRFPVVAHKPNAKSGYSHGEVPLVRIEIRPR